MKTNIFNILKNMRTKLHTTMWWKLISQLTWMDGIRHLAEGAGFGLIFTLLDQQHTIRPHGLELRWLGYTVESAIILFTLRTIFKDKDIPSMTAGIGLPAILSAIAILLALTAAFIHFTAFI